MHSRYWNWNWKSRMHSILSPKVFHDGCLCLCWWFQRYSSLLLSSPKQKKQWKLNQRQKKTHEVGKLKQWRKVIISFIIIILLKIIFYNFHVTLNFWPLNNYLVLLHAQYTDLYIDIVNESSISCPWGSGQQWHHCQRKWHCLSTLVTNNLHLCVCEWEWETERERAEGGGNFYIILLYLYSWGHAQCSELD